jgi:hypothetical protein
MEPRLDAIRKGTSIVVPDIQRPVLLSVLRGRVEEFAGAALYLEQKNDDAIVRLRRAVGVLPDKSSWWRSSLWRLGAALDLAGKSDEAFIMYSRSYANGPPDKLKFTTLQGLCQRLYNTQEGCEDKVALAARQDPNSIKPANSVLKAAATPAPLPTPAATPDSAVETVPAKIDEDQAKAQPQNVNSTAVETLVIKNDTKPNSTNTDVAAVRENTDAKVSEPRVAEQKSDVPETKITEPAKALTEEVKKVSEAVSPTALTENITAAPDSGETRKRTVSKPAVVYANKTAQVMVGSGASAECELLISGQKLSIVSNGGWSSLNVDLKGEGNQDDIKLTTESTADLALELQAGIGRDIHRVVYIVRSISQHKGEYKIFVESPCGEKKEIIVTVK